MAQHNLSHNYKQGYSDSTLSTHLRRTADSDAGFLLAHIRPGDHILDVGCGPGTITLGLAKVASQGETIGLDISPEVLEKAKALAEEAAVPSEGPGSVHFQHGNVLERLPFSDETFDIVVAVQLFGHIPPPDLPLRALVELRRVLKPNGIIATRDGMIQHFFPSRFELDRLWVGNMQRMIQRGSPEDPTATQLPAFMRKAGFKDISVDAKAMVTSQPAARKKLADRAAAQLKEGDTFRQSWLDAGVSTQEIQETVKAAATWADTEDAMFVTVQSELLAKK